MSHCTIFTRKECPRNSNNLSVNIERDCNSGRHESLSSLCIRFANEKGITHHTPFRETR